MSKFIALDNEYAAKGWAHAQALRAGEAGSNKPLYPQGARIGRDGVIELPDAAVERMSLRAVAKASATEALAQRVERVKPVRPTKPGKPTLIDRITGRK